MKKNEKILQSAREFISDWLGKVVVITAMIIIVVAEIVGLDTAVEIHNYFILALFLYVVVTIAVCYTKKVFLKALNYRLLKRTKLAELILYILAVTTILLSWKYFIAAILTAILAVIHADFYKVIEVEM